MGFSILDFNDRDLLYKLMDAVDSDGHASSKEIALSMGLDEGDARGVGSRFAWMRKYGLVDCEPKGGENRWFLTLMGRELLQGGAFSATVERAIDSLTNSQRVTVMDSLARDGISAKKRETWGRVYARTWAHRTGRR